MSKNTIMYSPVKGTTKDITKVNDPVFSSKMVGDGIAIEPASDFICSPCSGKIDHMFESNHAFTIVTDDHFEVLIHLGIDTVELKGKGFKRLIDDLNKPLKIGTPIIEVDFAYIKEQGKDTDVIVIVTDSTTNLKIKKNLKKDVNVSDEIFKFKIKNSI